jgi:hypothetical protein
VYVAGAGLLLLRLALGLRCARAIRLGAVPARGRLTHPACVTPITVGVVAPAVILPADWVGWDEAELSAVLAHEEEHVRRRDPLVGAVALLNRAIFWFHPLAWWLPREISRLSEQACDAAVIARGHDREVYGACLLRFARRVAGAGGRMAPVSMAMPGTGLQERLGMLARPEAAHPSGPRLVCAATACAALVVVCAAAAPTAAPSQDGRFLAPDQAGWVVDASDHFEIVHNDLPADRVSGAIRDAEAAYTRLSGALKHDLSERVALVLVPRDGDLSAGAAHALDRVLGDDPARRRVVISLESLDRRTGLIVHELTHPFAFDIVPDTSRLMPSLIEGLAEHQRGVWLAEDLRSTRTAVATGFVPSLTSLAITDRHWAHAVFDFVEVLHGGEGIRQLLFALRAHETLEQAVPMAFGVTPDQFDQSFRDYVTTRFGRP